MMSDKKLIFVTRSFNLDLNPVASEAGTLSVSATNVCFIASCVELRREEQSRAGPHFPMTTLSSSTSTVLWSVLVHTVPSSPTIDTLSAPRDHVPCFPIPQELILSRGTSRILPVSPYIYTLRRHNSTRASTLRHTSPHPRAPSPRARHCSTTFVGGRVDRSEHRFSQQLHNISGQYNVSNTKVVPC